LRASGRGLGLRRDVRRRDARAASRTREAEPGAFGAHFPSRRRRESMSSKYAGNPDAIRALVREDSVHRDVYLSEELFDLETRYLFPNTWIYVGHDSQVPRPGDFYTTEIGRVPVIMVRGEDGSVR